MIIDAHTHTPADRRKWPDFFKTCRNSGVSSVITSCLGDTDDWPQYPTQEYVRRANELAFEFCRESGGLVKMLVYINPQNDNCLDELHWGVDNGALGIKLWVSLKNERGEIDSCDRVLEKASLLGVPVLIHACNKRETLKGELTTAEVAKLAAKFPDAAIIEAHCGGYWQKDIDMLKPLKNVYVDISGFYPQRGIVNGVVKALGIKRVLFGSDMPLRTLPSQLAKIVLADLDEPQKRMILGGNARGVYNLSTTIQGDKSAVFPGEIKPKTFLNYESDYFCFCGNSPFECGNVDVDTLALELRKAGINAAYTASFDCIFAKDALKANIRFIEDASKKEAVEALPAVNPTADITEDLFQQIKTAGIVFVSPYLNNYAFDCNSCKSFFIRCADNGIKVFVNCALGDYRFRPVGSEFRNIEFNEIADIYKWLPENCYIFQGLSAAYIKMLLSSSRFGSKLKFEISRLVDFNDALESVTEIYGFENLLYGSEYPLRDIRANRWIANQL